MIYMPFFPYKIKVKEFWFSSFVINQANPYWVRRRHTSKYAAAPN